MTDVDRLVLPRRPRTWRPCSQRARISILHPACGLPGVRFAPGPGALSEPGWSVVHHAAALGSAAAVQALRQAGRLDEPSDDGFTVLHQAVALGGYAAVELLLQQGARVDARSPDGQGPMDLTGSDDLWRLLIGWEPVSPERQGARLGACLATRSSTDCSSSSSS